MSIQLPTLNRNGGTCTGELLDQLEDVVEVLEAAVRAVNRAEPHERDFGPEEHEMAKRGHESRLRRLVQLRRECESLMDGIDDGGAKPGRVTVQAPIRDGDDPTKIYWTARIGVDRLWVIDGYCLDAPRLIRMLTDDASFSRAGEIVAEIEAGPDRAECLEIAADACEGDSL